MGLFRKKKKEEQQWQDAVLTLYACNGVNGIRKIPEYIQEVFINATERFLQIDKEHYEIFLKDHTTIKFNLMTDPDETIPQAMGMAHYFSQAELEDQTLNKMILKQITIFNCIIGIEFQMDDNTERRKVLIDLIFQLAQAITGFVLTPNMSLFHYNGKLLISIEGETAFDSFYPESDGTILDRERGEETQADIDRKERSIAICKEKNIPCIEHLKAFVFESECKIPAKEEIVRRLAAVFAASVCSEVFISGQYEEPEKMAEEMMEELDNRYDVWNWLSDRERAYLSGELDSEENHSQFNWKYECCAVLLWALSLMEIGEPVEICSASEIGAILWNNDFDSLMQAAQLRSKEELLDMQDLMLRYDWACVDARINEKEITAVNGSVVYEWHYALNWLVGADGITDWDEVQPNT